MSVKYTKEMNTFQGIFQVYFCFPSLIHVFLSDLLDLGVPMYLTKGSSLVDNLKNSAKDSLRKTFFQAEENNFYISPVFCLI